MRPLFLLVFACIHEFSWQALPWELQGYWRNVTQWALIFWLCGCYARSARELFASAVCVMVALMSSTTAICSAAWLVHPWPRTEGGTQCSQWLGWPVLLVSVGLAVLCLGMWTLRDKKREHD